jgi:hypothetical protein
MILVLVEVNADGPDSMLFAIHNTMTILLARTVLATGWPETGVPSSHQHSPFSYSQLVAGVPDEMIPGLPRRHVTYAWRDPPDSEQALP